MAKLNTEQLAFLEKHGIAVSKVLDVSGMPNKRAIQMMKDLDMWLAFGGTPCEKAGHQLRNKKNACVQCRTAEIGFRSRFYMDGYVYILHSSNLNAIKVGMASDPQERIAQLNSYRYGGASNWRQVFEVKCELANQVEFRVHKILSPYQYGATYYKDGEDKECRELFRCGEELAKAAVHHAISMMGAKTDEAVKRPTPTYFSAHTPDIHARPALAPAALGIVPLVTPRETFSDAGTSNSMRFSEDSLIAQRIVEKRGANQPFQVGSAVEHKTKHDEWGPGRISKRFGCDLEVTFPEVGRVIKMDSATAAKYLNEN